VVTFVAAMLHAVFRQVEWGLVIPLLIGSLPGIYLGTWLCARLPEKVLRPLLATVIFATGVKMV
jgi:uncharacterized membrane protein YfcA